ncbi:MAG TPA: hypothetical protein VM183_16285 [Burkholderiales bacterium]|nr:hypothetical protein [Burkholderiales bacterium]
MTRLLFITTLALWTAACSEGGVEPSMVSEAVASPVNSNHYGWRSSGAPAAHAEGSVVEYY